jgi:bifunctional DNA-binding transcriptional regulator/antitoxin component of YhaV-PrlF toxin-antitoxin module
MFDENKELMKLEQKTKSESEIRQRYQITIPQEIREKANLNIGNTLLWMYDDFRKEIILMQKPKRFSDAIFGLGKELLDGELSSDGIRKEREEW